MAKASKNGDRPTISFTNEELALSFDVWERPTVREQLRYKSLVAFTSKEEMFERYWNGAKTLVTGWQCDLVPSLDADLDELTDPAAADVIVLASNFVASHLANLETVEKN